MSESTTIYVVFNQPSGTIAHCSEDEPSLRSLGPSQTYVKFIPESSVAVQKAQAWEEGYDAGTTDEGRGVGVDELAVNPYLVKR